MKAGLRYKRVSHLHTGESHKTMKGESLRELYVVENHSNSLNIHAMINGMRG